MFQSTPAIAGGRIPGKAGALFGQSGVSIHARHCWRANPRVNVIVRLANAVSIHARHCWRANPAWHLPASGNTVVSIHARHCWRANPALTLAKCSRSRVSIHARHCWRANPSHQCDRQVFRQFQSTPAIAGGRIPPGLPVAQALWAVSIHARHCWRANPTRGSAPSRYSVGFNPRPPLLAGESGRIHIGAGDVQVSIHARHCWRANPLCT